MLLADAAQSTEMLMVVESIGELVLICCLILFLFKR